MSKEQYEQYDDDDDDDEMDDDDDDDECEVMPMSDDELVSYCMYEISNGTGGSINADTESNISTPLDYYFGRLPGITKAKARDKNASRYVSQDVHDAVEATVAEIMPTFTVGDVAFYEPENDRDDDQSRMESEVVNYLLFEEYDGHLMLQTALKDALLHRNCSAKVYWDNRVEVSYEDYEGVPQMRLQEVLAPRKENERVEITAQEEIEPDPMKAMAVSMAEMVDPEVAQMAAQNNPQSMMQAQPTYNLTIKRSTPNGRPVIESVPPENVIVSGDHRTPMLQDVRFVAHEKLETESSLIEQGFDPEIVKQLGEYTQNIEDIARSRNSEEFDYSSGHHSTRQIRVFECYYLIDFDGDGIAERRKIVISSNRLLSNDTHESVSVIGGATQTTPHRYRGVSLYDRLKAIQDAKTPVMRAIIDGTQLSSTQRIGVVTGEVNLDDLITSRTGGIVRMDSPNSLTVVPNPEVPASSYNMLSYMDAQRTERGGAAVGTATQAQKVSGDTAHGIERAMAAMELGNAHLARTMGETFIRGIFIEMHNVLRENFLGEMNAKVNGKWVVTIPSEWKKRTSVSIQIGSSPAERARQSATLQSVIGFQKELIMQGSTITNEAMLYKSLTDAINLSGVNNPERYFVDPASPEGKQAGQQKAQKDQQAKQKQDALEQQQQAAMQQSMQATQKMADAEMMKGQADMLAQQVKLQLQQQKMESDSQINMLKLQLQQSQDQANSYKDGAALRFDYEKLQSDEALAVTKLELQKNADLTNEVNANRPDLKE